MSSVPSVWIWLGIVACVAQSALFSGLNLAVFSLSQLRLQIQVDGGDADAARVLALRKNSNQVLATVISGAMSAPMCCSRSCPTPSWLGFMPSSSRRS
jgi:metal transporter CNNM